MPPVTIEFTTGTGLTKHGFVPKLPVPLRVKSPFVSASADCDRLAVTFITGPFASEKVPAYDPVTELKFCNEAAAAVAKAHCPPETLTVA